MTSAKIDEIRNAIRFPSGSDPVEAFQSQKAGGICRPGVIDQGLRRLMLALLEDALDSYRKHFSKLSRKGEICFREVEEWLHSDEDGLFSFATVCESLGIDAGWLRSRLVLWKQRQLGAAPRRVPDCGPGRIVSIKRKNEDVAIRTLHPCLEKQKRTRSARP